MRWLKDLPNESLAGKRVLLRLDLNVPIVTQPDGTVQIRDDQRIKRSLPTLEKLTQAGALVTVISHLGESGASLTPLANHLKSLFPNIVVRDNLRLDPGEEGNEAGFAAKLAESFDLYVNEAFSVSHRPHASVVGVPALLPSVAGLEFQQELEHLSALLNPQKPLLVIIGGAKFGTKLPLVRRFLDIADKIFIGGALAHPIFKLKGWEIGHSLSDDSPGDLSDLVHHPKVVLPSEVLVCRGESAAPTTPDQVPSDGRIVDAGPKALTDLQNLINNAKTILWNGPLGNYEQGYGEPTNQLARAIAASGAKTIIGGGDTIAAIESLNIFNQFTFVSTAGGAMLDYLATGTLPGIEALVASEKKFG